jgi:hypothetical protein
LAYKTDEQTRNMVVELLKEGNTYREISEATVSEANPKGLSKPTVWSIKKEAGLPMKAKNVKKEQPVSTGQSSQPAKSSGYSSPTVRTASGDGVSEFQPEVKKVKAVPVEKGERITIQCDHCGVLLEGEPGDEMPEVCPECGR